MASETQSFEMFIPDTMSKQNEKTGIYTKKKLLLLIVVIMALAAIIILGILQIPIYVKLSDLSQEKIELTNKLTKIIDEIEETKTNELKMDSKISFAHFRKAGGFGYFQILHDKMSYFDGQAACHKIHGKIIECDERHRNASRKFYEVGIRLNLKENVNDWRYFDVPFYIGLINIGVNRDKTQWRWSSTGRSLSKNSFGETPLEVQIKTKYGSIFNQTWNHTPISWAKGANNGKKLRGNCAMVNYDAELKEINCYSKLTIICEEL